MPYAHSAGIMMIGFLSVMMGLKFFYVVYSLSREINDYKWNTELDWGDFTPKERERIEEEWQQQSKTEPQSNVEAILLGEISRYSSELHFYRRCGTAYEILGCADYDTQQMIKKRYRLLVQRWRPDRIRGGGATAKELEQTTEILQIINGAYEMLRVKAA